MAEVAIGNRIYRHEAKPQPTANAPGKVVEAFGLGKCPKLAEQVNVILLTYAAICVRTYNIVSLERDN